MPDLDFHIEKADVVPYAASPLIALTMRISQISEPPFPPVTIHSVALRCQVRLEPGRRRYSPAEQEKLVELFAEPQRWGQTLRSTLWMNTSLAVPSFVEQIKIDLPLACTYDFNVATTKYFYALEDGEVPLSVLLSGTIFYADEENTLQVEQISWEKEATFRLPVAVWKQVMELYYPNTAWLCLRRDAFDALYQFKIRRGFPTWEQAIETLVAAAEEQVPS